ncbi:hypothetical protein SOP86_21920 [Pseudomonas canadensis]|uniref:hypothetical protein n=1 Tax=Pseudomonas canadensis TaxID=915099 RepID=UPI002B247824|nr:hypothetical protein [Pseudomonas canadensis]MEB2648298.1 hypothetical protein [Pseudomonas canadensis]
MSKYAIVFSVIGCSALYTLIAIRGWPWSVDSRIDLSSIATLLAVIVALWVALRDSLIRLRARQHKTACFVAYNRPAVELILKRVAAAGGVIEKYKKIRLGETRPYDAFKYSSLVVQKGIWADINFILESISALPVDRAEMIASALGALPMLKSDYETLAMMQASVPINGDDQELISSILSRSKAVVDLLKKFLALNDSELDELVGSYREVLVDGENRHLVTGFSTR